MNAVPAPQAGMIATRVLGRGSGLYGIKSVSGWKDDGRVSLFQHLRVDRDHRRKATLIPMDGHAIAWSGGSDAPIRVKAWRLRPLTG